MSFVDMTKYNGIPLTNICSGGLPGNGSYTIQVSSSELPISRQAYDSIVKLWLDVAEENRQLRKRIEELEANNHGGYTLPTETHC